MSITSEGDFGSKYNNVSFFSASYVQYLELAGA